MASQSTKQARANLKESQKSRKQKEKESNKWQPSKNGVNREDIPSEPPTSFANMSMDEILEAMHHGASMLKVRSANNLKERYFNIDRENSSFGYINSNKCVANVNGVRIKLADIREVREGYSTDKLLNVEKDLKISKNLVFSVIYGRNNLSLDIIVESSAMKDMWVKGLKHLVSAHKMSECGNNRDCWIKKLFSEADANRDGRLTLREIIDFLRRKGFKVSYDNAKRLFREADTDGRHSKKGQETLDMKEFIELYKTITKRPEMNDIFEKYAFGDNFIDPGELEEFMQKEQLQTISRQQALTIIEKFEPIPGVRARQMLSIEGFRELLESPTFNLFNPEHRYRIYQDMAQPLNQYFIASSHNTYLAKDQLTGPSSVEMYILALRKGCRCVELDCWDGPKNEPLITHGNTLTSKIHFKDVITAINDYAFATSEYPVILSIENHCSVKQQDVMAKYLRSILKSKLFIVPESALREDKPLPSPEQLKGKILIKGQKLPLGSKKAEDCELVEDDEAEDGTKKTASSLKLSKSLSDTIAYCASVGYKGFEYARSNYRNTEMSSFAESKALKLSTEDGKDFVKHNCTYLSRVFPGGLRTDSSNYNPVPMWTAGCQIVALNYQTGGVPLQINDAKFMDNGHCGYILQPPALRNPTSDFDPAGDMPPSWNRQLDVTILSGFMLPKSKGSGEGYIDPYVKVEIFGIPKDNQKEKTRVIQNNGFNPCWAQTLSFNVACPSLAIVRFEVRDYDGKSRDDFIAQFTVPFSCMQEGYRTVNLRDKNGEPLEMATLLVKTTIENPNTKISITRM
ncbi:unnamed protein product [Owenia fusiformis]|uniref:Phosphoinositide phospholipase C n=1 Tax=Owenia fusiformis TaxID=6347 RepID=A0A8J1UAT5_OWEFU|nr:unnamed protein product [Owenia fusiformis]